MVGEAGPFAVDFAAFDLAAEDEHGVGVAVVGAAGAVLVGGAAEFGHGDKGDVFGVGAHVAPEGGYGIGEVTEAIGELAFDAALVLVSVPAADVGEGGFYAEVGFEKLGDLLHVLGEGGVGVVGVGRWRVVGGVGGAQHLDGFEARVAGGVEDAVAAPVIHRFKGCCGRGGLGAAAAYGEVLDVADGERGDLAFEGAGNVGSESYGAEGGVFLTAAKVFCLQGAVEPAVAGALDAGGAGFHEVLGVEVGAGAVGRSGGVDDGQMPLLEERLERGHGWVQSEEAVEVEDLILRDGDGGPHGVVVRFAPGDDDVEAVGCSALEDNDELLTLRACLGGRGHDGAGEEGGQGRGACERQCAVA